MSSPAPPVADTALGAEPVAPHEPAATPAQATPSVRCENCGATVPGRYCGNCGQRVEPPVHSLWHFARVATEDLTHADSRLWRTLGALLFKPGYLTREFLGGRRARYLPPVRLYLVLSVAFFVWAAAGPHQLRALEVDTSDSEVPGAVQAHPHEGAPDTPFNAPKPGESIEQRNQRECSMINYEGPWQARLTPAIRNACLRIRADNGRSLQEAYLHNMPRAMFLFLPLLAAAMMLLYWRPRHYYVEHLLLFVHNHAFVFLIVMVGWGAAALVPPARRLITWTVVLYVLWYAYRSMRVTYGQGRWLTVGKFAVLAFFYFVFGLLMFLLNFVYSALTM
jgi:hypothetical protein